MRKLCEAISDGNFREASWLLEKGADPNEVIPVILTTPLHEAVYHRHHDLVVLLLAAGANPNAQNASGYTALHMAAPHPQMVQTLVNAGADPYIVAKNGQTALDVATQYKEMENIVFLKRVMLNIHAKQNTQAPDFNPMSQQKPNL